MYISYINTQYKRKKWQREKSNMYRNKGGIQLCSSLAGSSLQSFQKGLVGQDIF